MLWFKGWLETRWRLFFGLGMPALIMFMAWNQGKFSRFEAANMLNGLSVLWVISAIMLAGTGIKTQSGSITAASKGLHGSTSFTLSLPITRFRLFAIRTTVGLLGLILVTMVVTFAAFIIFPGLHAQATTFDAIEQGISGFTCTLMFYFVAALFGTWLDPVWQIYGSLAVMGVLRWLAARVSLPPALDVFRATGDLSPLFTHAMPWPAMGISLAVSAVLFITTLWIIQSSEY